MSEPAARVLVVDAERFFREAIRDALATASIPCEVAASAEEALKAADDRRVGVVVLDVALPGMGAIQVLRRLQAARPALRVIALAVQADQGLVLEALRLGACDYLAKPLHDEELVLAVRRELAAYGVESSSALLRHRLRTLEARLADLVVQDPRAAELPARAAEAAAAALAAGKTSLMLLDEGGQQLRVAAATGRPEGADALDPQRLGEGVAGLVLARGAPLLVGDAGRDERIAGRTRPERYASRSFALAPVVWHERPLGVLCATDREGGASFGEDDLLLLRMLALLLAPLLAGAGTGERSDEQTQRLSSEEESRLRGDAELAREICDALTLEVEPARLIEAVLRPVARAIPADPVGLYLIDNQSGELVLEGHSESEGLGDRPRLSRTRGLTATVLQTGRIVAADHPETDPRFDTEVDTPRGGGVAPLLCVPVRLRGKVLGVLRAFPVAGAGASPRTGEILAAAISAAVRNVLLYRSLLESIDEVAKARQQQGVPAFPRRS